MTVTLIEHPDMAAYRLGPDHPLRPERFTLAIALMRAWDLVEPADAAVPSPPAAPGNGARAHAVRPRPATVEELELAHDGNYIEAVVRSTSLSYADAERWGLGPGDTPVFPGMHEAASLAVGGTIRALEDVVGGRVTRSYHPGGGLHHAHRDHASGFCVYNDTAVAIEKVTRAHPGIRIAYVDIDAHHGDGVEAAFADRSDVLTLSVHESGAYLFPGTGRAGDIGIGAGAGLVLNVPLLPHAGPESYRVVLDQLVVPALRRFRPDVVVLQAGADSHRNDPLTHLHNSVEAFDEAVERIVAAAVELCDGRIVAVGGGGYDTFSAVPRMWACVMCRLLGITPPPALPTTWIESTEQAAGEAGVEWLPITTTFAEHIADQPELVASDLERETEATIKRLRAAHPLFR